MKHFCLSPHGLHSWNFDRGTSNSSFKKTENNLRCYENQTNKMNAK